MAFFDKLNDLAKTVGDKASDIAKNVGDKANDAIESTKLRSKIHSEQAAIAEEYKKIGEFYYEKHRAGEAVAAEITEYFYAIDGHNAVIDEANAQLKALSEEPEAQPAPAAAAPVEPASPAPADGVCPACGRQNAPGTKFCSECGAKL